MALFRRTDKQDSDIDALIKSVPDPAEVAVYWLTELNYSNDELNEILSEARAGLDNVYMGAYRIASNMVGRALERFAERGAGVPASVALGERLSDPSVPFPECVQYLFALCPDPRAIPEFAQIVSKAIKEQIERETPGVLEALVDGIMDGTVIGRPPSG